MRAQSRPHRLGVAPARVEDGPARHNVRPDASGRGLGLPPLDDLHGGQVDAERHHHHTCLLGRQEVPRSQPYRRTLEHQIGVPEPRAVEQHVQVKLRARWAAGQVHSGRGGRVLHRVLHRPRPAQRVHLLALEDVPHT